MLNHDIFYYRNANTFIWRAHNLWQCLQKPLQQQKCHNGNLEPGGGNSKRHFEILSPENTRQSFENKKNHIILTEKISSDWQHFKFEFQTFGNRQIKFQLGGPKKENSDHIKYPVVVDYQDFKVNNKLIFSEPKALWDNEPFEYILDVNNGDIVVLEVDIRRHHWTFAEMKTLQHINPLMFLSVFILAFFFSYQIVQYIAQYKLLRHYSRVDIIFLSAFVIMLLIPASHITQKQKSMQENRMLNAAPSLFMNNTFNTDYPKQFENWFNDRFRGRKTFLKLYTKLNTLSVMIKNDHATYHKKTHWTFNQEQIDHEPLSAQTDAKILSALQNLNKFLSKNGIKFYLLIVPEKLDIYKDFNGIYMSNYWDQKESSINISTINFLKEKANFPIIYPLEELKKASEKDFVFYKTEHHWTEWGAYQGYDELIKNIQKKFSKVKILTENDFEIFYNNHVRADWDKVFKNGQTLDLLNLGPNIDMDEVLDTPYKYYSPKSPEEPKIIDISNYKIKHFKTPNSGNHIRVFLTGTSMNENLISFLPYSFQEVIYYRLNSVKDVKNEDIFKLLKRYKKDILKLKPNLLILTISAGNLPYIVDLDKE